MLQFSASKSFKNLESKEKNHLTTILKNWVKKNMKNENCLIYFVVPNLKMNDLLVTFPKCVHLLYNI